MFIIQEFIHPLEVILPYIALAILDSVAMSNLNILLSSPLGLQLGSIQMMLVSSQKIRLDVPEIT